jgi:hypothetical protein
MNDAGSSFSDTPSALQVSAGSLKLWAINKVGPTLRVYTDTLADTAPTLVSPADGYQNPMNPVQGRTIDIAFTWERPSFATVYDVDVYTDAAGTVLLNRYTTPATTSSTPVVLLGPYAPNPAAPLNQRIEFSPGMTYYWRVRVAANGPVHSPWSEMRSFTIEPGTAMVSEILAPENGATAVSQTPSFSWQPVSQTTEYRFVLADNVALANPIVDVKVKTSGYSLTRALDYGKTYFWAVQPVAPVMGEMSALANFTVMAEPTPTQPPITVTQVPAPQITLPPPVINLPTPQPAPTITIPPAPPAPAPIAPAYIWAVIIIGAILVIAVIVLIVRTRRAV